MASLSVLARTACTHNDFCEFSVFRNPSRVFGLRKIPQYGKNIDTSIREESMGEVYSLIQQILQGVRYYQGPVNGDQELTHDALMNFQRHYNDKGHYY